MMQLFVNRKNRLQTLAIYQWVITTNVTINNNTDVN